MRYLFTLLALLVLGVAPTADGSEVYRCVSESGVVSYSDKPCGKQSEKLAIKSERTDRQAVQEGIEAREQKIKELDESAEDAAKAAEQARQEAEQRKQLCADARERLQKLVTAQRITVGEGDERRFLEDDEIIERRQQAQDKVNEYCGG